jgi:hypothetical protein
MSKLERTVFLCGGAVLVAGALRATSSALAVQLNADLFYVARLYQDLVEHAPMNWRFPPAPYFFPDLPLFYALARPFGIAAAYSFYGAAFLTLFVAALVALYRSAGDDRAIRLECALAAALLLTAPLTGAHAATRVFFIPIFHAGTLLVGVGWLAVALRASTRGFGCARAALFFFFAWLGALSDLFFVLQFALPFALACALERRRLDGRPLVVGAALLGAAALAVLLSARAIVAFSPSRFLGNEILESVESLVRPRVLGTLGAALAIGGLLSRRAPRLLVAAAGSVAFAAVGAVLHFRRAVAAALPPHWPADNLVLFARDMATLVAANPLLWVWLPLALAASAGVRRRASGAVRLFATYYLIAVPVVIVEVALTWVGLGKGKYAPLAVVDEGTLRHMQPAFVLPPFVLAFHAVAWRERRRLVRPLVGVVAVVCAAAIVVRVPATDVALELPYPEPVRCLDRLIASRGLEAGYGSYWTARHFKMLSRTDVHLESVLVPGFDLDRWVANLAWYLPAGSYPRHSFFVPPLYQEQTILARFGEPAARVDCAGAQVFVYDRPGDVAVRNLLRVPALLANGRPPPSRVVPEALTQWRPDGAAADGALLVDGALEAELVEPRTADLVEISAEGGRVLDVEVRGDTVARTTVSTPAGAGLLRGFASFPRVANVRSLTLRPRGGAARVGHLFVYRDQPR